MRLWSAARCEEGNGRQDGSLPKLQQYGATAQAKADQCVLPSLWPAVQGIGRTCGQSSEMSNVHKTDYRAEL
jgi:hypothetical protein